MQQGMLRMCRDEAAPASACKCRKAPAAADGLKAEASDFRLCMYEITNAS